MSDVRRLVAYALFAFCCLCYVGSVAFDLRTPEDSYTSWGTSGETVRIAFALATFCFPLVGVLVLHRDPRNTIGWLMTTIGVIWGWVGFTDGYVVYGLRTAPGSLPRPDLVAASASWSWIPAIGLTLVYLILLFPDGHLPSPRWRVVAWAAGAAIVLGSLGYLLDAGTLDDASVAGIENPLGVESLAPVLDALSVTLVLLPICMVLSAASLVVRFRRSQDVERLQLKWLATAGAFVAALYAVSTPSALMTTALGADGPTPQWLLLLQDLGLVSFALIPLSIGVAILKHRLYGIDVVISKSVVFGTLATFITVVYVGIVVGVGSLVGRGDRPHLALSIAATAVVAVAFQPVRDKVQRFANRLVYGARATPYEVLADFADRMGGAYAAGDLLPRMARTVADGVRAAQVEVWLVGGTGLVREAVWPADGDGPEVAAGVDDLVGDRVVAVRHQGELLGAVTIRKPAGEAVTRTEERLLDDVGAQAGLVLRNVRLIEDLRASRQRLVSTQDEERRRLERNLHDGAQQSLVAVALMIRMVRARLDGSDLPTAATLDEAADQLGLAIEELRDLARGIHPAILTERGLGPALVSLAERAAVPVVVDVRLDGRLPEPVEGTLYQVAAEALSDAAHSSASEVQVRVFERVGGVALEVTQDGVQDLHDHSWLQGIRDRVAVLDGSLETRPTAGGTLLVCTLALARPAYLPAPQADAGRAGIRTSLSLGAVT